MTEDPSELKRQEELRRLQILDSPEEGAYNDLTRRASELCGAPISLITLVDSDRQWFKAKLGMSVSQTPRQWSCCSHAIEEPDKVLVVNDATTDDRFKDNPLVTGDPNIRFYAGAPLVTSSGAAIGSLCVIDSRPRELDPEKLAQLQVLAARAVSLMEKRAEFSELFENDKTSGNSARGV